MPKEPVSLGQIRQVEYCDKPGRGNTVRCLEIVAGLVPGGYAHVVIPLRAVRLLCWRSEDFRPPVESVVAVTRNVGYARPNEDECGSDMRRELASLGVRILTGSILTRGIEPVPMNKHQVVYPAYVVAQSLNVLCQGIKATAEIVAEASDGGLLPEGADVVAIALNTSVFIIPDFRVKNREDRLVVLNRVAASVVDEMRGMHADYVFTYRGKGIKNMYGAAWRKARERAGLPEVRLHDLKHTFGRRLRAAGVSFEDRRDLLGHKSGQITTHYSGPELRSLIEAANKVCSQGNDSEDMLPILRRRKTG